jgi:PAS domain S-box-containing protein
MRHEAEVALLESEERYAAIFNQAAGGIAHTDLTGRYTLVNDRYCEILGRMREEVVGRTMQEFTHPDDLPLNLELLQAAIEEGRSFAIEKRYLRQDGSAVWVRNEVSVIKGSNGEPTGVLAICSDISEKMKAHAELARVTAHSEKQKRLYEAIISSTPDLVYVFDRNYRFTFVNDALLEMWGRTLEESVGRSLLEIGYEPWHAEMHEREIDQVIATKQSIRGEVPFRHNTLGWRIYDYILVPVLSADGEVEAIAGTTRDITERKRAEEALERQAELNAFRVSLSDELRSIANPIEVQETASRLICDKLECGRAFYYEHDAEAGRGIVHREYKREPGIDMTGEYTSDEWPNTHELASENSPLIMEDATADLRLPPAERAQYEALAFRAFVVQPLHKEGKWVASFVVGQSAPREWEPSELEMIQETAERTWSAVERARSDEALRRLNETLEERIAERTAALIHSQEQLHRMAARLTMAEQEERRRISEILHDDLQQRLYGIQMKLDFTEQEIRDADTEAALQDMVEAREWLEQSIALTRQLTVDLSPPILQSEGLADMLRWLVSQMQEMHMLDVALVADEPFRIEHDDMRVLLFQIVRELLFNVVKHASASKARVELLNSDEHLVIHVSDDGNGFSVSEEEAKAADEGGFGLFSARERLGLFDGTLVIESEPGSGTQVTVRVPLSKEC